MQTTTQSDQDKMVPIDTSGESVEIELKEEKKEEEVSDSPAVEVQESEKDNNQDLSEETDKSESL